jgi:HlyD family secretion protein
MPIETKEKPELVKEQVDISKIEIRSEEVQEIMGYIPHWLIRWGISLFFAVIFLILVGSWFFKYPAVISSSIVVTTTSPPASIVALTSGKIQHLFVKDKQEVAKNEYIAIIENSVNHLHLSKLKIRLDSLKSLFINFNGTNFVDFKPEYSLGELQSYYSVFLKAYADYRSFIELDYHYKNIKSLNEQIEKHQTLDERSANQVRILEEELQISRKQYERNRKLYKDGIISQNDFETAKSTHLQKEYSLEGAWSASTNTKIRISQLRQSILDLELREKEERSRLQILLNQAYENLSGQVAQWEQRYVLKAPIKGIVAFTRFWSINQNVKVGDNVITIVPEEESEIIGKVVLPVMGSGRVKPGQKVNIKFSDYPHMEFGMVRGIIKSKSLIAADNHYHLEVTLPHGLKTNYGKELKFVQEMQGIAEVVTEDIRMLERLFKPIKSILKKHTGE